MRWISNLLFRLRAVFARNRLEREMDEEMRFHLEMEARKLMREGMAPADAARRARRRFGSTDYHKERTWESWGIGMVQNFFIDARHTLRSLRRNPVFAAISILTLGLGIGANSAIFSVVNGILLQSLPFEKPDRLVSLCETMPDEAARCVTASTPNVADWAEASRSFEEIGVFRWWGHLLRSSEGSESVRSLIATPEFFRVMRYRPALGRVLQPRDQGEGNRQVAVLDHDFWTARFGADPAIVGTTINLSGQSFQVVGVLREGQKPPAMSGEPKADVWLPLHFDPREESRRDWRGFYAVGRLAPEASLEAARDELTAVRRGLLELHPEANAEWGLQLSPLKDRVVGGVRTTLLFFLAAVGLVLLITCANIANLILARMNGRGMELSIRTALGADAPRLAGLLLNEGLILALLGGGVGLALAWVGTPLFLSLAPAGIPRLNEVGMDWTVLTFTLGLAVLTTLLFGLAPLARAVKVRPMVALRGGRHGKAGGRSVGLNEALVVTEVALALALLVAAGLLVRSFASFHRWDPGFEREHLLTVSLTATTGAYESQEAILDLYRTLDEELEALPGVESVARSSAGPLFGGWEPDRVLPEERAGEKGGIQARWYDVSPAYFETLGVPVVRGRGFSPDDGMDGPLVVVVNETLARLLWPGEDPVGRKLRLEMHDATREVLGVVADVPPVDPDAAVEPEMFWPQAGYTRPVTFFVIRTGADPAELKEVVVDRIQEVDPDLQTGIVRSFDDLMDRRLVEPRFNMLLITIFGVVALILAGVGIYGVISRSVASRTREIGIRIALGAPRRRVLTNVVAGSMALTGVGVAVGLLVAFALSRFIASLLHGVPPNDPVTYSAVALGLIAVAFFASLFPALGASRVDPMTSLREE